jgi:P-type Cu+ transporter
MAQRIQKMKDPVCGMETDNPSEFNLYKHGGKDYYFCSEECKSEFKSNPCKYLSRGKGSKSSSHKSMPSHM